MEPFTRVSGVAAPFPSANIDTDVIMPKQFLKGVDRSGLAQGVFHDLRRPGGRPDPDFILNQPAWRDTRFLVVGPNFGCGSSREHAVWGLKQLGVRALLGSSYAGIFFDNCARNGLLALTLPEQTIERLLGVVADPLTNELTIDLPAQTLSISGETELPFEIGRLQKEVLIEGLDPIGTTLKYREAIIAFETAHHAGRPWLA